MSTLKTTIVEHASVLDLPERFRGDLAPGTPVTVIVLAEGAHLADERPRYLRYRGAASHLGTTTEEAVAGFGHFGTNGIEARALPYRLQCRHRLH